MSCEDCDSGSFVLPRYVDEEVERSYSTLKTPQTPDQDSPITKEVTEAISGIILCYFFLIELRINQAEAVCRYWKHPQSLTFGLSYTF